MVSQNNKTGSPNGGRNYKTHTRAQLSVKAGSLFLLILLFAILPSYGQVIKWEVLSPVANSTISGDNLFIAVRINPEYSFGSPDQVKIFLDNSTISGSLKISGNKLRFLYPAPLSPGVHELKIEAAVAGKKAVLTKWTFSVAGGTAAASAGTKRPAAVRLSGLLMMDNRNEFLSGTGARLRQEPDYTRTLTLDAAIRYKNAEVPVRLLLTSNNRYTTQSTNYYQVGFRNRWVELAIGDLNPNFDQLILTGVRVRGGSVKLKFRGSSIAVVHGELNQGYEGNVQTFIPGIGILPTNLINDSQYVAPGIYKRTMSAARLELGNKSEGFKIGLTAMKAKDDINSIKYGLAPKENIAGGLDLATKLFRRSVTVQAGVAGSVYTDNISTGAISKETLDTTYHIKTDIDPKDFESLITMNASTVPLSFSGSDFLAWYGRVNYTNKYQSLFAEYRKNGPLYHSLGNPFLLTNYEGFTISERVPFFKRKLVAGLTYMNYFNNLNGSLSNRTNTQVYKANISANPGKDWPMLYFSYLGQRRHGKAAQETVQGTDDLTQNFMISADLGRKFWNIDHHFRIMFNYNTRDDRVRQQNNITSYYGMIGINENFGSRYNINAEFGKTILKDGSKTDISNISVYSIAFDWQVKPEKYFAALKISNNQVFATSFAEEAYRMSLSLRLSYRFWRGMGLDAEGGYQPYRSKQNDLNSYDESYVYLRYTCDLGRLLP